MIHFAVTQNDFVGAILAGLGLGLGWFTANVVVSSLSGLLKK